MSESTQRHTGTGNPEKISDHAIELVYTSFRNNHGDFWPHVKAACSAWLGLGRKLHGSATFMATNSEIIPGIEMESGEMREALQRLGEEVAQKKGTFIGYLMAALGGGVSFTTTPDGGLADPAFVSKVYDFAFPFSSAKLLQEQIGMRGQELYSLSQIQKFFKPDAYVTTGEVPNHVDNFIKAYNKYVPNETQDRTEITTAFFRIAEVTDALKSGTLSDETVARRNFSIAAETIIKAVGRLDESAPPAHTFQDVDTRSAIRNASDLLKHVAEFREARGKGQGVV